MSYYKLFVQCLLLLFFTMISYCCSAHNTNTTHTLISDSAIETIQLEDKSKLNYAELYYEEESFKNGVNESIKKYWGTDPKFDEKRSKADDENGFAVFRNPVKNVIDGVVQEDDPVNRVFSHFYHAYSGIPMTFGTQGLRNKSKIGSPIAAFPPALLFTPDDDTALAMIGELVPSKQVGVRYFDQAIEAFGYVDEKTDPEGFEGYDQSKELGFWLFGHSLHHVEDMNSIAHTANDPHLTDFMVGGVLHEERDDNEAHFIPTQIWRTNDTSSSKKPMFNIQKLFNPKIIKQRHDHLSPVKSFDRVWPKPIKNPSLVLSEQQDLFANSLARGVYNMALYQAQLYYPVIFGHSNAANGELAEMFNSPNCEQTNSCRLTWEWKWMDGARWSIDGVGSYFYRDFREDWDSTWWEASEYGGPKGYFYIEQIMRGTGLGKDFNEANLVRPYGIRKEFTKPYGPGNPVIKNDKNLSLAELYSENLLPFGVWYSASYSRFWYDIANTPPYLKKVTVKQQEKTVYAGLWEDKYDKRLLTLKAEAMFNQDVPLKMVYVKERILKLDPKQPVVAFINPDKAINVMLEFNEPIKDPREKNSGFSIGFDNIKTLKINDDYTVDPIDESTGSAKNVNNRWMQQRRWMVSIKPGVLGKVDGRIPLKVTAQDLNNHHGSTGAELDDDPSTPARRQRRNADKAREDFKEGQQGWDGEGSYPWHTEVSVDINFKDMKPGDFAYTYGQGDTSHVLLFDSTPPEVILD
ncbi:hypothetical protein [Zooshikella sp. RANM57]|uniref:hypothetical protein n=1 Tax=Zooshikella sp. RANM57 TaxID=3425863 RepID=UPI003D6F67B2